MVKLSRTSKWSKNDFQSGNDCKNPFLLTLYPCSFVSTIWMGNFANSCNFLRYQTSSFCDILAAVSKNGWTKLVLSCKKFFYLIFVFLDALNENVQLMMTLRCLFYINKIRESQVFLLWRHTSLKRPAFLCRQTSRSYVWTDAFQSRSQFFRTNT